MTLSDSDCRDKTLSGACLSSGYVDLGCSGETRSFTGPSVSPLLGANGAQVVELSLVAKAARHEVGQPFQGGREGF